MIDNLSLPKTQLLLAAAGRGTRLGRPEPKALIELAGAPLVARTLERFSALGMHADAIVVAPPDHLDRFEEVLRSACPDSDCTVVAGGSERQDSVAAGLERLDPNTEIVAIHDAARPFITQKTIARAIEAAATHGAATVAIPCVDTILQSDENEFLAGTPDRHTLWACQTPQAFRVDVIRAAYDAAKQDGFAATDDASLVSRTGARVKLVQGERENMKITTPADLQFAEFLFANQNSPLVNAKETRG